MCEFWAEVGSTVGHTGPETETLFKNLHTEYQRIKMRQHVSGVETVLPTLRCSEQLYELYDSFYQLFYPHGGSAVPALVMTESCTQMMMR